MFRDDQKSKTGINQDAKTKKKSATNHMKSMCFTHMSKIYPNFNARNSNARLENSHSFLYFFDLFDLWFAILKKTRNFETHFKILQRCVGVYFGSVPWPLSPFHDAMCDWCGGTFVKRLRVQYGDRYWGCGV